MWKSVLVPSWIEAGARDKARRDKALAAFIRDKLVIQKGSGLEIYLVLAPTPTRSAVAVTRHEISPSTQVDRREAVLPQQREQAPPPVANFSTPQPQRDFHLVSQFLKLHAENSSPVCESRPQGLEGNDPTTLRLASGTQPRHPYMSAIARDNDGRYLLLEKSRPFVMLCFGKQGSGKSNSQNVVMESHLFPPSDGEEPEKPFGVVAFHFDSTATVGANEHLGLIDSEAMLKESTVLVSPSNLKNFKFYADNGFAPQRVKFNWSELLANHISALMHIDPIDPPLYATSMLKLLRDHASTGSCFQSFAKFKDEFLAQDLAPQQRTPVGQRFDVIESFLSSAGEPAVDFGKLLQENRLILIDLTDPFLSRDDANAVIFVLLSLLRDAELPLHRLAGKMVVFDEAHKYFADPSSRLCLEIVNLCEVMRHENTRILITSQMPSVVPPLAFQLSTFTVIHHFHTPSVWSALQKEYPLHTDPE